MADDEHDAPRQPDPHHMFTALTTIIGRTSLLIRQLEANKDIDRSALLADLRLIERESWAAVDAARVILDQHEPRHEP